MKSTWMLLGAGILSAALWAADWPQWRGPRRTGISQETGLLQEWPKDGPKLLWQLADIGDGYATPAVVGGGSILGNRGMENEFVQALSVEDGKTIWSTRLGNVGNPNQQPPYPMARSTPTVDGDMLYALSSDGDLACLETASGKVRWRKSLRRDFGGQARQMGLRRIAADRRRRAGGHARRRGGDAGGAEQEDRRGDLEIGRAGRRSGRLRFGDRRRGRRPQAVCPVPGQGRGRGGCQDRPVPVALRKTSGGPANIPTPVSRGDYVYSANARRFGGGLVQLHATGDGVTRRRSISSATCRTRWAGRCCSANILRHQPEGPGGRRVRDRQDEVAGGGHRPGRGAVRRRRLYFHGENGDVALVEATPEAYREKGRFTPPGQPKRSGARERAWAYPVVANGRLYIRDLGTLWCYDVRAAALAA